MADFENDEATTLGAPFAPVEIQLPSLQQKHTVIIYDSKRYPGRSSEWFFHKSNRVSGYHVYRCVRCKSVNEKHKRSGNGSLGAPARIYIQNEHFMNDPDFPFGEHICKFETNPECETSNVYAKRAILEANKDMRINPERPMAKYVKMLTLFDDDSGKYGHLDTDTKKKAQRILNQVGNGFNARKRGLMLNYQLGKRQQKKIQTNQDIKQVVVKSEIGQDIEVDIEGMDDTTTASPIVIEPEIQKKAEYVCGGPACNRCFKSIARRTRHRALIHPGLKFIDTEEDLFVFKKTLQEQQLVHPILTEKELPPLPFAVIYQEPNDGTAENENENDYSVYSTVDDSSTNTGFLTNVNEYLNALHNISYYLPNDETLQSEFCEDLHSLIEKYVPLQQVTLEEEPPSEEA